MSGIPLLSLLRFAFGGERSLLHLLSWGEGTVIAMEERCGIDAVVKES